MQRAADGKPGSAWKIKLTYRLPIFFVFHFTNKFSENTEAKPKSKSKAETTYPFFLLLFHISAHYKVYIWALLGSVEEVPASGAEVALERKTPLPENIIKRYVTT